MIFSKTKLESFYYTSAFRVYASLLNTHFLGKSSYFSYNVRVVLIKHAENYGSDN